MNRVMNKFFTWIAKGLEKEFEDIYLEIRRNQEGIQRNQEEIQRNQEGIQRNQEGIQRNQEGIQRNQEEIQRNQEGIQRNQEGIQRNQEGIQRNQEGIQRNQEGIQLSSKATVYDYKLIYRLLLNRLPEETLCMDFNISKGELFHNVLQSEEYKHQSLNPWIKDIMEVKWETRDYIRRNLKEDTILTCTLCGYESPKTEFDVRKTECIFNGGVLERHVCPQCGVIFGDEKFTKMTQREIDHDYSMHYRGYFEGDSTDKEIRTFYALNPNKESLYLNYGCGVWSHSMEILRREGYQVYGYEPYAGDEDNPYIISNIYDREMKFDGIFSNDLLEHCINPVEDLKKMKSLLKNQDAKMAHSTSCYAYKYEYTRFHTHFFVGDSLQYLAAQSGLDIVEFIDDLKESDFMCCVFRSKLDES